MDEINKHLLRRTTGQVGTVARDKSEKDHLDQFVKYGFVIAVGRDAPHSAPMSSVYRITDLGRTALSS